MAAQTAARVMSQIPVAHRLQMSEVQAPKILVIEDETTQRILAKEYLEESGYVVRLADDGIRGLEMAALLNPDLIILDLLLPSLDGYSLCTRLKQDPATADIPVILVTASREPDVIERGLSVGASDFVTKPVDWNYLADRVAHVLQQSEDLRRITAEKEASEQELQSLLETRDHSTDPVVPGTAPSAKTVAEGNAAARKDFEKEVQAVQSGADERVRKIEAAAQQRIRSEQSARKLDAENSARKFENLTRSFWSVMAATSSSHMPMLTALEALTSGGTEENATEESSPVPLADRQENAVQSLLTATRNMNVLSQYMLGNAKLDESKIDLVRLISQVTDQARPAGETCKLEIVADVPAEPVWIMADESRVRYVVHAMVMNAFKFCPPKGTVRIVLTAEPEQPVQIRIEDNGVGMPSTLVENLSASAEFPANALSHQNGRLGFGIPMSSAIAKLHGGKLHIGSEVGKGTVITIDFPGERYCREGKPQANPSLSDKCATRREEIPAAEKSAASA